MQSNSSNESGKMVKVCPKTGWFFGNAKSGETIFFCPFHGQTERVATSSFIHDLNDMAQSGHATEARELAVSRLA